MRLIKLKQLLNLMHDNEKVSITLHAYYADDEYYSFMTICDRMRKVEAEDMYKKYLDYEIKGVLNCGEYIQIDLKTKVSYTRKEQEETYYRLISNKGSTTR